MAENGNRQKQLKQSFLDAIGLGASVCLACRTAGVPRSTAYRWKGEDADFAQQWNIAIIKGREPLIGQAFDAALLLSQRPRQKARFVYLIRDTMLSMTKIGIARNLTTRFNDLQNGCPQQLVIIGAIQCANALVLERGLHQRFARQQYRGEWFDLSQADIDWILAELDSDD